MTHDFHADEAVKIFWIDASRYYFGRVIDGTGLSTTISVRCEEEAIWITLTFWRIDWEEWKSERGHRCRIALWPANEPQPEIPAEQCGCIQQTATEPAAGDSV